MQRVLLLFPCTLPLRLPLCLAEEPLLKTDHLNISTSFQHKTRVLQRPLLVWRRWEESQFYQLININVINITVNMIISLILRNKCTASYQTIKWLNIHICEAWKEYVFKKDNRNKSSDRVTLPAISSLCD